MKKKRMPCTIQIVLPILLMQAVCFQGVFAQLPEIRSGDIVPRDVREMMERGLSWLAKSQTASGDWTGGQQGPGVTGLCMMAFLASGEDPNFGRYRRPIRRALRNMITTQDAETGYLGNSMYHHGFGMLALAEAYGAVDDRDLWLAGGDGANLAGGKSNRRGTGQALELAVRSAVTAQKNNPLGAWRYSPESTDADTSVSGAVLVGLLAARNAGIEVPDASIDKAIAYYTSCTSDSGQVAYSGGLGGMGESVARTSIATLVYAVARRKDLPQYKAAIKNLAGHLEVGSGHYGQYTLYYQSQALFQGDLEAWKRWNGRLIRHLKKTQGADGSFPSQFGVPVGTSMSLLALALNYRLLPIYER